MCLGPFLYLDVLLLYLSQNLGYKVQSTVQVHVQVHVQVQVYTSVTYVSGSISPSFSPTPSFQIPNPDLNSDRDLFQSLLDNLKPFDELYFPNETWHLNGGIKVGDENNNPMETDEWSLQHVRIIIDGTLSFQNNRTLWPKASDEPEVEDYRLISKFGDYLYDEDFVRPDSLKSNQDVYDAFQFYAIDNVTFTSNGVGMFEGNGEEWWGYVQYLLRSTDRPKMMNMWRSRNILWENLVLKDCPRWCFQARDVQKMFGIGVKHVVFYF